MIFARKSASTFGEYVDNNERRYELELATNVRPTTGWTKFASLEECLQVWQLVYDPIPIASETEPEN